VDRRLDRELLPPGRVGNELLLYDEYPQHPTFGEGPWHLLPTGPPRAVTAAGRASVRADTSPAGQRLVVAGELAGVRYEQVLTVWTGLSRVDCTTRLQPTGSDRLLRLRWPTDVPGGLPVSEVGAAVIGRGYGIVDVDSADHPWTLDNPAYSWFGVGSTARVLAGGTATAVGVAEVVADARSVAGVRDLVVALVRAGVTSTTSLDTGNRYGALRVDSNLPDTRIAVGGPDRNAFTAAVLAAAPAAYADELDRQLAATGRARVWVPAERPLPEVWEPSADLRGLRALPVLVLAGRDEAALAGAVADLVADLADATIGIGPAEPGRAGPSPVDGRVEPSAAGAGSSPVDGVGLADVSVAMLSRGLPGFAVDRTGALHLSLARSCTGWPSAAWIDKPRRTVPDGSGFQLQHWTHTFDYALTSGSGDWRSAGFVPAGQGFTAPPTAVVEPAHPGPLPPVHSLLAVEPAGAAVVTAVKPVGAPLAAGVEPVEPVEVLAVRMYEAHGRRVPVRIRLAGGVAAAERADLLDRPTGTLEVGQDGAVEVPLEPCEVATVLLRPAAAAAGAEPLVPEPAGVVPARYWLENAGPAPAGNLPVSVHASPTRATGPVDLLVSVASSLADAEWTGVVTVTAPDGWSAEPAAWPVALPAGGWADTPVRVAPAADAVPGDHLVAVSIEHRGQTVRDLVQVRIPGPVANAGGIDAHVDTMALALRPGERDLVRVEVASSFRSPLDATLELLGPVDTWPLVPQWTVPVRLDGDDRRTVELPVEVPAGAEPGEWWVLARLSGAGQVAYSNAIRLMIT
jgi:alpha-mannosidase